MANSTTKSSNFHWQGRHDKEDGALGQRVHHIVKQQQNSAWQDSSWQDNHAASLLGFCCDAGVARNKGRIGAKKAPDAIRRALANMAWHHKASLLDLGNVECKQDQLEQSQAQCAALIASALPSAPVITLGGGHEVAWASFQGLAQHLQRQNKHQVQAPKIGIINFDAHFDLRFFEQPQSDIKPSSGTPFYQIYHYCAEQKWPFQYACLGVSRASNTQALFKRADELAVFYLEDRAFTRSNLDAQLKQLQHFIDRCDYLYLSIDLDVFPAATAPGVSAPAAMGVSLEALFPFIDTILQQRKLIIADIAEYNPNYDLDDQTARLAARLCWEIANGFATQQ